MLGGTSAECSTVGAFGDLLRQTDPAEPVEGRKNALSLTQLTTGYVVIASLAAQPHSAGNRAEPMFSKPAGSCSCRSKLGLWL